MSTTLKIALGSIVVALGVLALKLWAAALTGSVALFSDALESIVNVATALAALVAIRFASRPADEAMPYGYYKAEYFSAVIEGVFIVVAALLIFYQAWQGFLNPQPLEMAGTGLAVSIGASVINAGWCFVLIRQGRRLQSPALEADGQHLLTDVLSSVGVVVGLTLALVTGWIILDAVIAALVGLNILYAGFRLLARSVGGLMDVALPKEQLEEITKAIRESGDGALEAHDIRARQAGRAIFIDFHLVVPGTMSVSDAHEICDRIEAALKAGETETQVTIHVEPDDKAKHSGLLVL